MTLKTISLWVTPEIDNTIDFLQSQLNCSREEVIRRCILYCSTFSDQVVEYPFNNTLLPQEV